MRLGISGWWSRLSGSRRSARALLDSLVGRGDWNARFGDRRGVGVIGASRPHAFPSIWLGIDDSDMTSALI